MDLPETLTDTICNCGYWIEEHDELASCGAPGCTCPTFRYDPVQNTPSNIADRGGEHDPGCVCAWCR